MAQGPTYRVKFRRRREGRTNYYRRRRLLLSRKPRIVIRKSNTKMTVQVMNAAVGGDMTEASAVSTQLANHGWEAGSLNLPAAYLTGLLAGRIAKARGISEAVLDIGLNPPVKGSRVYAALKGVIDAGIDVPHGEGVIPDDERICGKHIVTAFEYYSGQEEKGVMFSKVGKKKTVISALPKAFESTKKKIMSIPDDALKEKAKPSAVAKAPAKKAAPKPKREKPAARAPRAVPRKPKPKRLIAKGKGKKPKKAVEVAAPVAGTETKPAESAGAEEKK